MRALPSQEYLRQCLDYNPATGVLTWRERPGAHFKREANWRKWNAVHAGQVAGRDAGVYRSLSLGKVNYYAHRLIWKLVTGKEPVAEIDHRDGWSNAWDNLREATHTENGRNRVIAKHNALGIKGVRRHPKVPHRFTAQIKFQGKHVHLGMFATAEEAKAAYDAAARELHGEFSRKR